MDGSVKTKYGEILHSFDEVSKNDYYDLYDENGTLVAMDGEGASIIKIEEDYVLLRNEDGEICQDFKMTRNELEVSSLMSFEDIQHMYDEVNCFEKNDEQISR